MNDERVILAIDTSNYTTSVAIMGLDGALVANTKKLLTVKPGERGLRQSDALFLHTVNIPEIMQSIKEHLKGRRAVAVGVSEKPRNEAGSYMPCFLSGVAVASGISAAMNVPLYRFSHQCGHIMAALYSSGRLDLCWESFAAFHVSGGTTELVRVKPDSHGFSTEIALDTADLNAGQIIDRVGVYMGLGFPAGAELEKLAIANHKKIPKKKITLKDTRVNLSGLENMAVKLYDDTNDRALTAAFVLDYIGRAICAMCDKYVELYGEAPFVFAGGVMCNSIIKKMLFERYVAYFAEPEMSSDNAVGIAALTLRAYKTEKK